MSEQGVFDVLTALYVVAFFLFIVGTIVWTGNRRRARKHPGKGYAPPMDSLGDDSMLTVGRLVGNLPVHRQMGFP